MNDSLRTDVFLRYTPEAIACACIYLAARWLQISLPNKPPWYLLFNVDQSTIDSICMTILQMYNRPKPNFEKLEKLVEEAKKKQLEEKVKAKAGQGSRDGTPNSFSRTTSPKTASPTLLKKIKTEDGSRSEHGSSEEKNGIRKRRLSESEDSLSPSHSRSQSYSRSSSRSPTPLKKKRRSYTPVRRHKKERYDDQDDFYYKDKRSHKKKRHARSHSSSLTPPRFTSKVSKKYSKVKRRSATPDKIHHSRKHRNGQRDASPRDRYEKYRR